MSVLLFVPVWLLKMLKNKNSEYKGFQPADCRVFFDFDNTISKGDVLDDIIQRFSINRDWVALQEAWLEERISAKECLLGQMKGVRISPADLSQYLTTVVLDPHFSSLLAWLRNYGVEPIIVSDNFQTIIEQVLQYNNIHGLTVYANHLEFSNDSLVPSFPYQNPNCRSCAHCKKTHFQKDDPRSIVYIGDGRSDICAAKESDRVYAKDTLLKYFQKHKLACVEFANLGDVHEHLKEEANGTVVTTQRRG